MDDDPFSVREARPEDVPAVLGLWEEFMDHHAALDPYFRRGEGGTGSFGKWLKQRVEDEKGLVLVAESDGLVVGYLLGSEAERPAVFDEQRYGMVYDLAVTASRRRRGIGARLLDGALERFAARGVGRVELNVLTTNEPASAFWEKHGFSVYLERRFREI